MGEKVSRTIFSSVSFAILIFLFFSSSPLAQVREKGLKAEKPRISASSLREVAVSPQLDGLKVELKVDGTIPDFNSFKLDDPPRLVLDFPGMSDASPRKRIVVGNPLLQDIRIGQHTDKVRVVFTFPGKEVLQHQITKGSQTLEVFVGQSKEENASLEKPLKVEIQGPGRPFSASRHLSAPAPVPKDMPYPEDKKPYLAAEAEPERPKPYSGARISLDFINADIREVFRLIGNAAEREIIPSDEVTGTISLRLIELPWDHALDIILANRNLQKVEARNVIYILPAEKALKERKKKKDE